METAFCNLKTGTVVVKSQNSAHNKKTLNFEKTKDTNDCIKQSSVKTPNRVPEFTTISSTEKNVDIPNDSYLHKKFKKVAEISAGIAKTEKAESKVRNGFGNDVRRIESYNVELVPKVEERILNNCNSSDVKSEDGGGQCKNDTRQQQQQSAVRGQSQPARSVSPPPKPSERTKSPVARKEEAAHLSSNPGRYVCSYCQLACAKPSVLQKHIRAHTNERPYPCSPCGFAFKTKSNLYKHCRSQAHRFKTGEGQTGSEKCDSGEDMSDDSNSIPAEFPCLAAEADATVPPSVTTTVTATSPPQPQQPPPPQPQRTAEPETNESQHKIYKPKFHKAALYQDESAEPPASVKARLQEGIYEKQRKADGEERPRVKVPGKEAGKGSGAAAVGSLLFGSKNLPPSPEFLHQHISKIISDNQAIVETMEPQWTKKFLQRQNSREKEMGSPLSNVSSPGLDLYQKCNSDGKKKDETKSKLALALLKVDKTEVTRYSSAYPKPEVNSDTHTYQPLNLTKKDSEDKGKYQGLGGSTIKEILIKSREADSHIDQYSLVVADILTTLHGDKEDPYPKPKYPETGAPHHIPTAWDGKSPEKETTVSVEAPYLSPGPLLGSTPLVETKTESGPPPKKRRLHSTTASTATTATPTTAFPVESDLLYRRLSTSSLPCTSNGLVASPSRPSSSPSTTLKSLEELSKHPMKPSTLNMFGGEVKILDCGETKTMRIESMPNHKSSQMESPPSEESTKFFVTIAKTGLHSGGGAVVHVPAASTPPTNSFQMANILNYPDATKLLMPLIPNITAPNLAVPGIPTPQLSGLPTQQSYAEATNIPSYNFDRGREKDAFDKANSHNCGILTIVHCGKSIPYVPGIPGPQTVLPTKMTEAAVRKEEPTKKPAPAAAAAAATSTAVLMMTTATTTTAAAAVMTATTTTPSATKSTVSSLISVRKLSSSDQPKNVPNEIPKIEISSPKCEGRREEGSQKGTESSGLKFLRPTSLPLKPGSFTPKRLHQGITPTVLSLVSPETPRPKKSYGQLFLNGHAYTYLGLKCSTRSYYCTISRPQPMYVVQSPQHPKLSMYSNWKVYSESEPSLLGLTPAKAMAHYDSRHRSSAYTIADKSKASGSTGIVTHSSSWLKSSEKQASKEEGKADSTESSAWSGEAAPKRVKIFAGGYASNEDYTYVRGRGRGRYVCEECGIRCKKPSMLKKHIRTHTDVRPYTCKHCTFSFKTKGNLTKHMKSKAHYKKCMEMNISPIPTTVEAENIDEELLLQQQALRQDGNEESENEEEEEDDESDGGDDEETTTEDPESLEREAACSLISLSETTTRSSQYKSLYIAAGLIPKNVNAVRPTTYPYLTVKKASSVDEQSEKEPVPRLDETSQPYALPTSKSPDKAYDNERPIDLSQKESRGDVAFLSKDSEFLATKRTAAAAAVEATAVATSTIPVPAYLLASIANSGVQYDKINADLAGSHMLQAYLTAKALQDVKMKQQQNHKSGSRFPVEAGESPDTENLRQFDKVSHLHHNFCRIYEKTVENESVNLKRYREDRNGLGVLSPGVGEGGKRPFEVIAAEKGGDNCLRVSLGDLNVNKIVDINKLDEDRSNERVEPSSEERLDPRQTDKSDNVSVTVETSTGKMILVSFPPAAESERLNSPPTGFLSKSGDNKLKAEFFPPSSGPSPSYVSVTEDGRSICVMCNKIFTKASQLKLHVNIHYFERPYRCEACAVSFRTKGHLLKHERSGSHHNKVSMNTTFGTATTSNPRPFKCDDCKIAFRIHGHLAKHLRSKMHIMKLECIGKLPFGTYAEMERSGVNLNEIDTTDCENSLESLQVLAQKLYEKDPSKLGQLENSTTKLNHSTNEDEVTNSERDAGVNEGDSSSSDGYQFSLESPEKHNEESNELVCNNSRVSIKKEVLHFPDLGRRGRVKADKVHGCSACDERFDNLTSLQVHLFAEHNRDINMDLLNKLNGKSGDSRLEKTIKSNEESLINAEKGK